MSQPIIEVKSLSKKYQIRHMETSRQRFLTKAKHQARRILGKEGSKEEFWALKNIDFQVKQGEILGVVGQNGSGKSTLLKILSRITDPTSGTVTMRGKTASLLEVGTGFHPELTGRENVYLNGSILGMSRKEIDAKFDDIVAFSEVEKFLDTPVKFYSSGMYVRLAFSVAAHLEPDILIVDEVLAVGDAKFQKKSLKKMNSAAESGRTILFVSHSMATVKQLCHRAILLEDGRIKSEGETEFVTDSYLSNSLPAERETDFKEDESKQAQILGIELMGSDGEKVEIIDQDDPWTFQIRYVVRKPCPETIVSVEILNMENQPIFMTADADHLKELPTLQIGRYEANISFEDIRLTPGIYYIRTAIQAPSVETYDIHENFPLKVRLNRKDIRSTYFRGKYMGYLANQIKWKVDKL